SDDRVRGAALYLLTAEQRARANAGTARNKAQDRRLQERSSGNTGHPAHSVVPPTFRPSRAALIDRRTTIGRFRMWCTRASSTWRRCVRITSAWPEQAAFVPRQPILMLGVSVTVLSAEADDVPRRALASGRLPHDQAIRSPRPALFARSLGIEARPTPHGLRG